jgi:hypothetical protein
VAAWQPLSLHVRQRQRWLAVAKAEAEAAERASEDHIAEAFRIVVATLELDCLPAPVRHGRDVLKGRQAAHDRAIELVGSGLSVRTIAGVVGQPYGTVYAWLRKAGLAPTREQWRESVRGAGWQCLNRRATPVPPAVPPSSPRRPVRHRLDSPSGAGFTHETGQAGR